MRLLESNQYKQTIAICLWRFQMQVWNAIYFRSFIQISQKPEITPMLLPVKLNRNCKFGPNEGT